MGKGDKRGGHNRKSGPREPNGRISRSKATQGERERIAYEESAVQTVMKARRRHRAEFTEPDDEKAAKKWRANDAKPVSKAQVRSMQLDKMGCQLGLMCKRGQITPDQWAAGERYAERYSNYARLNGLPRPTAQGTRWGEPKGQSRVERIRAAVAAKHEHQEDQRILRHCSAGTMWAIKRACVLDEAAPPHLVREGLKELINGGR